MSKQSDAKIKQNYQEKPLSMRCRECIYLKRTFTGRDWSDVDSEKLYCGIGEFKVKANAVCNEFRRKETDK